MIFYALFLLSLPQPNHGMGFMGIFQDLKLSKNSSADPCRAENLKVSFFSIYYSKLKSYHQIFRKLPLTIVIKMVFQFVWLDGLKAIHPIQSVRNQFVISEVRDVFMGYVQVQRLVHVVLDGIANKPLND